MANGAAGWKLPYLARYRRSRQRLCQYSTLGAACTLSSLFCWVTLVEYCQSASTAIGYTSRCFQLHYQLLAAYKTIHVIPIHVGNVMLVLLDTAMSMHKLILPYALYVQDWLPARKIVEAAVADRCNVDASGAVISLQPCPWKEHLFMIEEELGIQG